MDRSQVSNQTVWKTLDKGINEGNIAAHDISEELIAEAILAVQKNRPAWENIFQIAYNKSAGEFFDRNWFHYRIFSGINSSIVVTSSVIL